MVGGPPRPFTIATEPSIVSGPSEVEFFETVLRGMTRMYAWGSAYAMSETLRVWDDAVEEGLVHETDELPTLDTRAIPWQGVTAGDIAHFAEELRDELTPFAQIIMGNLEESFIEKARELTEIGARELWSKERYVSAMTGLAERFGVERWTNSWAATWYDTNVLTAQYNRGVYDTFSREPTRRLYPYFTYVTRRDNVVRPNHAHLDGFTASTAWPGWPDIMPPNGWNCRCIMVASDWMTTRAIGWEGDFPLGFGQVATWSGPDSGFPKV